MLVGVIGHPIAHSLSPRIHNAALEHDGREARYEPFDVEPARLEAFIADARADGAVGFNVTIPHKSAAFELCTSRSDTAERTKAVNTLLLTDGVAGHNTDVHGVRRALEAMGAELSGARVLVAGAGGAGRAAAWAAIEQAGSVLVANRTGGRAQALVGALGAKAMVLRWTDFQSGEWTADVLVQATSVGLDGAGAVVDAGVLPGSGVGVVLDLVYGPHETPLVLRARELGLRAADGLDVLVHQAAEAYRLFWDADPPLDVMRRAAREAAGRS